MVRWVAFLSIAVSACASQSDEQDSAAVDDSVYESSGSVFFIPEHEIDAIAVAAVDGNDQQLQRLIDFYMFSYEHKDDADIVELQRWQTLGAERNLKGSRYNLMYMANASVGPECSVVRTNMSVLDQQSRESLTAYNSYVKSCIES